MEGWRSYRRRCGKGPEESRRDRTEMKGGMKGKGGKIVKGTGNYRDTQDTVADKRKQEGMRNSGR